MMAIILTLWAWAALAQCSQCLERRAATQSPQYMAPLFSQTTSQVCGWITADVNNPFMCNDGQYCNTISGFFACCNGVTSTYISYSTQSTYTYTLSLTASDTTYEVYTNTGTKVQYSYLSCGWATTCYDSYYATSCTADCASNGQNLLCTASDFPYCQVLTMAHIFPNTTYTAFQCAQTSSNTIALYNGWSNTPVGAGAASSTSTSTTSTSTYSATTHVPTSVTQSSLPASAAATITNMPSPTSGADQLSLPYSAWIILTLLLTL